MSRQSFPPVKLINRTISISNIIFWTHLGIVIILTCVAQISAVKSLESLIRDRRNISVLVGCACVQAWVMNILSTVLIQIMSTSLPVSAENWFQCPRKSSVRPSSYVMVHHPVLWVQYSRWCPSIFCRVKYFHSNKWGGSSTLWEVLHELPWNSSDRREQF